MVRMAYVWLWTITRNAASHTGMVVWLLHLYICIYTYVWNTNAKGPVLHDARRGGETTVERCYMYNGHLSSFHLLYAIDIKNIKIYRTSLKCLTATSLAPTDTEAIHPCMQDPSPNRLSPSDISSPLFFRSYQDTALQNSRGFPC